MKIYIFLSILLVNLTFAQAYDINAKTKENKNKIFTTYSNYEGHKYHKYKDSLWFYDEQFSREMIKRGYIYATRYIKNENVLDDKKLFLKLVKENGYNFQFASPRLRKDRELLETSMGRDSKSFEFTDESLKRNRAYVLSLIQDGHYIYLYINKKFYADREITLLSVKQHGNYLKLASQALRNDKELVLAAIQENGNALEYASDRLKKDEFTVYAALKHKYSRAIEHADISLKNNRNFILQAVKINPNSLTFASKALKKDKSIVWEALKGNPSTLIYADKSLLDDKRLVMFYIINMQAPNANYSHKLFKKIDVNLLNDEDVIFEVVSRNGMFLQYASKRLKKNKKIVLQAVDKNGLALQFADKELLDDKEIIVTALKNTISSHQFIPYDMKNSHEIANILNQTNSDKYIRHIIKRKIHSKAWQMYDVNDTIEALYGKNRVLEKSEKIKIELPDFLPPAGNIKIHISTQLDVKSIAILQNVPNERCLTTLYYPRTGLTDFSTQIKSLNQSFDKSWKHLRNGIEVVILTETKDNHIYVNNYLLEMGSCNQGYDDAYIQEVSSYLKSNAIKTKYAVDEDKIGHLKFMIMHPMISYRDAQILNEEVNFISHIEGKVDNKKVFDLYTSEYTARKPLFKIKFQDVTIESVLKISYTNIHGNTKSTEAKTRRYNNALQLTSKTLLKEYVK